MHCNKRLSFYASSFPMWGQHGLVWKKNFDGKKQTDIGQQLVWNFYWQLFFYNASRSPSVVQF